MKVYRVYECYPDGTFHDLNKVIEMDRVSLNGYGGGELVEKVFKLYGFTQYVGSYYAYQERDNIHIRYNYGGGHGAKDTWILKPETDEGEET